MKEQWNRVQTNGGQRCIECVLLRICIRFKQMRERREEEKMGKGEQAQFLLERTD